MAEHGGYRMPSNPAPVSGPGKFSGRTDGQTARALPDAGYGEQAEFQEMQGGAPMSDTSGVPAPDGGLMAGAPPLPTRFDAPTEMPDTSVTTPFEMGGGDGLDSLGRAKQYLPLIAPWVDRDDVPDEVRALYRYVRDA